MDWPDVVNGALTRADDNTVRISVIIVMVGAAFGVGAGIKKIIESRFAKLPPATAAHTGDLKEFLQEFLEEMERRFNIRAERMELRMDRLVEDGAERDIAIARLEVRIGLDPILDRKDRRQ